MRILRRILVVVAMLFGIRGESISAQTKTSAIDEAARAIHDKAQAAEAAYLRSLVPLSNDPASGAEIRAALPRLNEQSSWYPRVSDGAAPPTANPAWMALRTARAEELWSLARESVAAKQTTLAWNLAQQALYENPAHPAARSALGFEKYEGRWLRPATIALLKAGNVEHPKFGWLPAEHVKRYEDGSRSYRGKWLSIEDDARLRTTIQNGWRIESENYVVTTNHSLEEGVRMMRRLEDLREVWLRVYAGYLFTPEDLKIRFDTAAAGTPQKPLFATGKRFSVALFGDREQYNTALKPAQPRIDMTLGIYFAKSKTAYFFAGEDQDPGTVYHEATHQLFQETRPTVPDAGGKACFWMVEAAACYMETLTEAGNGWTVGGAETPRMLAARQRLLVDGFYVPLDELCALNVKTLQSDARLPKLYSQSAGLWQFFMHARDGAYREPVCVFLRTVYADRATGPTFAKQLGRSLADLDGEYREYLKSLK